MRLRSIAAGILAAASIALAQAASATIVYSQLPVWSVPDSSVGHTWASQTDASLTGFRALDNFTLASDATINEVEWWGVYLTSDLVNGAPNSDDWIVRFQADSGGFPGTVLSSSTIPAAQVTRQLVGTGVLGTINGAEVSVYHSSARFPNFAASAGTPYWFSPLSRAQNFAPLFGWIEGSGGDHFSFQTGFTNGTVDQTFIREDDRAFVLASIPEPASWMLMLCAAASRLLAVKRRRAAA
jgi:hypothetical protein